MRAAIYNPYLDTLGGGERYTMAFASVLAKNGYSVEVEWNSENIKSKLEAKFGININGIKFIKDVKRGEGYDAIFWVSDGSVPILKARKNFLHFQFPFTNVNGKSLLNRMKLFRINQVICNSEFTKKFIDKEYGVKSIVLYPPVDTTSIKPLKKENLIVSVGRFSQLTQVKSQHVLIDVFKKMYKKGLKDWKLILAGGTEVGVDNYVLKLKKESRGLPVEIKDSPDFRTVKKLYGEAKIFWAATGFGIDEKKEPTKVEHFGITTIEAMAAGAVPIVFDAGGHRESVKDGENGFLWKEKNELIRKTKVLIENRNILKQMSARARESSVIYSYGSFEKEVVNIL